MNDLAQGLLSGLDLFADYSDVRMRLKRTFQGNMRGAAAHLSLMKCQYFLALLASRSMFPISSEYTLLLKKVKHRSRFGTSTTGRIKLIKKKDDKSANSLQIRVHGTGLEPAQPCGH